MPAIVNRTGYKENPRNSLTLAPRRNNGLQFVNKSQIPTHSTMNICDQRILNSTTRNYGLEYFLASEMNDWNPIFGK